MQVEATEPELLSRHYQKVISRENEFEKVKLIHLGKQLKACGRKVKYPAILVPGTFSCALEVWTSPDPTWEGKRIWIDPARFGFSFVNSIEKQFQNLNKAIRKKQKVSKVLNHLRLEDDGKSDPDGIKIRPVEGRHAIDYLISSSVSRIESQAYVWSEIIRTLSAIGYDSNSLVCFPYDWRLAPTALNERDQVLIRFRQHIENLVELRKEKVALVGHSQGCKFIQFFLHWAETTLGTQWIDDHVELFIALGAPWKGSPKAVRALLTGDSMGVPQGLYKSEYIHSMMRTFSSVLWLLPWEEHEKCIHLPGESEPKSWKEVLPEHLPNFSKHLEYYNNPLLFGDGKVPGRPRTLDCPHVKAICSIYGVNARNAQHFRGTEIGTTYKYRRRPKKLRFGGSTKLRTNTYHQMRIPVISQSVDRFNHRIVTAVSPRPVGNAAGIIYERNKENDQELNSGDGTVPYSSFKLTSAWAKEEGAPIIEECEIEFAEHRDMMKNKKVVQLVADLLSGFTKVGHKRSVTIYDLPYSEVQAGLSDSYGIPYLVRCVLNSFRKPLEEAAPGTLQENIESFGKVFLAHKQAVNEELDQIGFDSRAGILLEFFRKTNQTVLPEKVAKQLKAKVFSPGSTFDWKGIGTILLGNKKYRSIVLLACLHAILCAKGDTLAGLIVKWTTVFFVTNSDHESEYQETFSVIISNFRPIFKKIKKHLPKDLSSEIKTVLKVLPEYAEPLSDSEKELDPPSLPENNNEEKIVTYQEEMEEETLFSPVSSPEPSPRDPPFEIEEESGEDDDYDEEDGEEY